VTLCFCRGMWRRRSWFSLNGKVGFQGQVRGKLLTSAHPTLPQATSMQHAGSRHTASPSSRSRGGVAMGSAGAHRMSSPFTVAERSR